MTVVKEQAGGDHGFKFSVRFETGYIVGDHNRCFGLSPQDSLRNVQNATKEDAKHHTNGGCVTYL